jgi:DNA-binding PucR family transcriptional regulator
MEQLWPSPSPECADLIRSVCQQLLTGAEDLTDAVTGPALTAQSDPGLLSDPTLTLEDRMVNRSDVVHWLTANIQHPGSRVEPYIADRTAAYFRDLASRGIVPDLVGGWRAGLAVAWRRSLEEYLAQSQDRAVLAEALDVTAQSMAQYAIDWFAGMRAASVVDAISNAHAEAIAMIQLIASGAPVQQNVAETRLNYRLARWHRALVLWTDGPEHADDLEQAVTAVRATQAGQNALVARSSTTSRWIWLSGPEAPDPHDIAKVQSQAGTVQAAVGRPGQGLDGFRSSHQEALAAQAMIVRLGSEQACTAYADIELIDALTKDRATAKRFVANTLGPLAEADPTLREALLTYVQCGFNTTRAAAALYAHRNTVERRVSRANELALVKVEDNPAHVAAALLVLDLAPDLAAGGS